MFNRNFLKSIADKLIVKITVSEPETELLYFDGARTASAGGFCSGSDPYVQQLKLSKNNKISNCFGFLCLI
jgi:hypothetical protein